MLVATARGLSCCVEIMSRVRPRGQHHLPDSRPPRELDGSDTVDVRGGQTAVGVCGQGRMGIQQEPHDLCVV